MTDNAVFKNRREKFAFIVLLFFMIPVIAVSFFFELLGWIEVDTE